MKNSLILMVSINSENEDMWAINRADIDEGEMVSCRNKISWRESDGVVGCLYFSKNITLLVILDRRTIEITVAISETYFL